MSFFSDGGREAVEKKFTREEVYLRRSLIETRQLFSVTHKGNSASHQPPEHALITWIEQPLTFFLQLGTNTTGGRENCVRIRILRVLYSSYITMMF